MHLVAKNIFLRNGYPRYLLDQKMKVFLNNEKPDKPEINATLRLNYTCANTETYCKLLVNKMKNSSPEFKVNIALRTVKSVNYFHGWRKQKTSLFMILQNVYIILCAIAKKIT